MMPVAIGGKNWQFVGNPLASRRAAVLMSLVNSCKDNRVEPWAYLQSIFTELPRDPDLSNQTAGWRRTHSTAGPSPPREKKNANPKAN